jgi:hypothetical protein
VLQGSVESFPIPDVMRFLASTGKTGRLTLQGENGLVSVCLRGEFVVVPGGELEDAADELFELLRVDQGPFTFDEQALPPGSSHEHPLEPSLALAGTLATEWKHVSVIIPHAAVRLDLGSHLPDGVISLDDHDWQLIRAVGNGASITDLAGRLGVRVVPATRRAARMVERGLFEVIEDAAPPAPVYEPIPDAAPMPVAEAEIPEVELDVADEVPELVEEVVMEAPVDEVLADAPSAEAEVVAEVVAEPAVEPVPEPAALAAAKASMWDDVDEPVAFTKPAPVAPVAAAADTDALSALASIEAFPGNTDDLAEPEHRALLYRFLSSVRS